MATFTGTLGADTLIGTAENDFFRFTPATLEPGDVVQGGAGFDQLFINAGGAISAAALAGVSGLEQIVLNNTGGNQLTLSAAVAANFGGRVVVRCNSGSDLLDASALLDPALSVDFFTGAGGADTLLGGAGGDRAVIQAAGTRLFQMGGGADTITTGFDMVSGADTLQGGAGTDRLSFSTAGSVGAAALAGLSSIEEIALPALAGMSLEVSTALVQQAGGVLRVIGSSAAQSVNASGVTGADNGVLFEAGTGADTFLGGAGADTVAASDHRLGGTLGAGDDQLRLPLSKLTDPMVFDGGAGFDEIVLTLGGIAVLGPGLTGFEDVILERAASVTLNTGYALRLLGSDGNDRVRLGGPGQTVFVSFGDDEVIATAASLLGSLINGGGQSIADTLRLEGGGSFNLRTPAVGGFERVVVVHAPGSPSTVTLPDGDLEVVLNGQTSLTTGLAGQLTVFGSRFSDSFLVQGPNQVLDGGGGNDFFQLSTSVLASGGIVLSGGAGDFDQVLLLGGGTADLFNGPSIAMGIEAMTIASPTTVNLPAIPLLTFTGSNGDDAVIMRAAGLMGGLEAGNDTLFAGAALLSDPLAAFDDLRGGPGSDTLKVTTDSFLASYVIPARITGFEILDLVDAPAFATYTIQGNTNWVVQTDSSPMTIQGGAGNERFDVSSTLQDVRGGDGADTITFFGDPNRDLQVLDGEGGNDVIVFNRIGAPPLGFPIIPSGWLAEELRLYGEFDLTTNTTSTVRVFDDPLLVSNRIVLQGSGQAAEMGEGNDTLRAAASGVTLVGGHGDDIFEIYPEDQPFWSTPGQTIIDQDLLYIDTIRLGKASGNAGTLDIDFTQHTISAIDRIEILPGFTAVSLAISDAMAQTANDDRIDVRTFLGQPTLANITVTAAGLLAPRSLVFGWFTSGFDGADTVTGGAGTDSLAGWGGNDLLAGGAGDDSLFGFNAADTLDGGAGNDRLVGDTGDDRLLGADGEDVLDAGGGADSLFGGAGNDSLIGGSGNDHLDGGTGTGDLADYRTYSLNLSINLQLTGGQTINGTSDVDTLIAIEGLAAGSGNDSLVGNSQGNLLFGFDGADTLNGLAGADTLVGGNGADLFIGGTGGDRIELAAGAADRVRYVGVTDGTADIDTTQPVTNADLIAGFDGSIHFVSLWLTQLGLRTTDTNPATAVKVLGGNETIDLSAHSVFILHPADTLGFSTVATDFGSFQGFADALNGDAGPLVNSDSTTRKAFFVPNGDSVSPRQTGLYLWLDSNANAVVETTDEVRLLAVFDGVSTAAFTSANFDLFI